MSSSNTSLTPRQTPSPLTMTSLLSLILFSLTCSIPTTRAFGGYSRSLFPPTTTTTALSAQKRGRPKGPLRTILQKPPMNEEISYETLRVVTQNPKGKDDPLGIMSKSEALSKAQELGGLDLILINANSDPPVCKIVDYSKYRYMKEKKAKELKKNSKATEIKEVKMSYKIDVHDYEVRKKAAYKFINQGNRVKFTVMFKGREIQHDNLGQDLLKRMAAELDKICVMEGRPKREGRNLSCIVTPRPEVMKAVGERKRAEEKKAKKKKQKQREEGRAEQAVAVGAAVAVAAAEAQHDQTVDLSSEDEDDEELEEMLEGDALMNDLFG